MCHLSLAPDIDGAPYDSAASGWDTQGIVSSLLEWASRCGRRPPWRTTNDQYRLATAEILLQKTKGRDAEPVWRTLVERYPNACSLASASRDEIQALVGSLGLRQQRATRLTAMARAICNSHGQTAEKLPSLGPYGSAILALTSGVPHADPPVDGNIARIVGRLKGLSFERGEPRKKQQVKRAVSDLLDFREGTQEKLAVVYALVDLGDSVCRPARPACASCPISNWCFSARERVWPPPLANLDSPA
jgi:A/G-specific adenine glycosylase